MSNSTRLTSDEIKEYRKQFRYYPEQLDVLDIIEECAGNLQDAVILMAIRDKGKEPDRGLDLDELADKYRPSICANSTKKLIDIVSILTGLLGSVGVALALLLYVFKEYGLNSFCEESN
ncbi:MAG TPA: hypothetical protein DCF68_21355 [Cyanothece sp. UBA12306]|nr:hypothetical protein [Cyanothece sp. UBA12306]